MFKKIFVFLAFMFPLSVFAFTAFITNEDNHLYTIKYKVCTAFVPMGGGMCKEWAPDTTVQVGPAAGSSVSVVANVETFGFLAVYLLSVKDEKNNALSAGGLGACSYFVSGNGAILSLFHLGNQVACKSGGFTKK